MTKKNQPYPTYPVPQQTDWLINKSTDVINDTWTKNVVIANITSDQIIPVSNIGNNARPIWIAKDLCNYYDYTDKSSTYNFRNTFYLSECIDIKSASLQFATDNICRVYINGKQVKRNGGWVDFPGGGLQCMTVCGLTNGAQIENPPAYKFNSESMASIEIADIKEYLTSGINVIAVENLNTGGCDINFAWICFNMEIEYSGSNLSTEVVEVKNKDCNSKGSFLINTIEGLAPLSFKMGGRPVQSENLFNDLEPGAYEVTVTDASGCQSLVQATIEDWTIQPELVVEDFDIFTDCQDTSAFIQLSPSHENYDLKFSLDGAPFRSGAIFESLQPGNHTVKAINEFGCESDPFDFEVFYDKGYIYKNQVLTICHGESVDLFGQKYDQSSMVTDTIIADRGCDTINRIDLRVEDYKAAELIYEICEGDTVTAGNEIYLKAGNYTQNLIGRHGCDSTLSVSINYKDERICAQGACDFYIPNVFSPNHDGINDYFDLRNKFAAIDQVIIYDRWGKTVYYGSEPDPVWDGTYRGKPMPSGNYIYLIKATCINGFPVMKKGGVTIVK